MVELQKPKYAFVKNTIVPWEDAVLHIGCEAVNRGLNVFEGVKGYWHKNGKFGIVELRKHYERLLRSANLLHIPCSMSYEAYKDAIYQLMGSLIRKEKDMWCRTTLFVVEGHWGEDTKAEMMMTAYHQDKSIPTPITLGISTWQRSGDISLPARIKTSTNYQVSRLARIEGRKRNCQDMVLLNQWGRVAEATGSCILMVRNKTIFTPSSTEGALESITVDIIEKLAKVMGINFVRRPIDRTELLIADEIAICGTLAELVKVDIIEGYNVGSKSTILSSLQKEFFKHVHGEISTCDIEFEFIPENYIKSTL